MEIIVQNSEILIMLAIGFGLFMAWGIGANDVANAMGTSVERASSIKDLYKKGESFGIAGKQVNGMDFFEVYEAVKEASDFIRKNKTPFLLELKTYRYRGHSMSDPAKYRAKDEVEDYKKHHDPIISLKEYILKNNVKNEHEIIELLDDINRDLINFDLEFRIQELESKFSKDLSEATFNELKELKKKQNIN